MNSLEVPKVPAWPAVAAVLINLIPVAGVLFWGWSALALIFLYWAENVVIGVRTVASMLAVAANGPLSALGAIFVCAFFTVHYGLFCFVHGVFVAGMFGGGSFGDGGLFDLAGVASALLAREPNLLAGFASIVLWQIVIFVLFLVRREWRGAGLRELMGAPYPRIIVLHVTIIFGGFVLMLLNEPVAGILVLALVKMAFDIAEALGKTPRFGAAAPSGEVAS